MTKGASTSLAKPS